MSRTRRHVNSRSGALLCALVVFALWGLGLPIAGGGAVAAAAASLPPRTVPLSAAHASGAGGSENKSGSITIEGHLSRPGPGGATLTPDNLEVYLVDLDDGTRQTTRTRSGGQFNWSELKVGGLYYVVAITRMSYQDGFRTEYQHRWDPIYQSYVYVPLVVPNFKESNLSWHQAITPSESGTFRLDLSAANADPDFCPDIQPTFEPTSRTPYRSWRRAELQPVL